MLQCRESTQYEPLPAHIRGGGFHEAWVPQCLLHVFRDIAIRVSQGFTMCVLGGGDRTIYSPGCMHPLQDTRKISQVRVDLRFSIGTGHVFGCIITGIQLQKTHIG